MAASGQVGIVGGGVAGLAAAQALYRRGIPAMVLESRAALPEAGLAVNLPGNAIRALDGLGPGR
jgi:2-polyprenyl-6-methoxyphenol hydroxylase-like FAD-dependent oxidoreductase